MVNIVFSWDWFITLLFIYIGINTLTRMVAEYFNALYQNKVITLMIGIFYAILNMLFILLITFIFLNDLYLQMTK